MFWWFASLGLRMRDLRAALRLALVRELAGGVVEPHLGGAEARDELVDRDHRLLAACLNMVYQHLDQRLQCNAHIGARGDLLWS